MKEVFEIKSARIDALTLKLKSQDVGKVRQYLNNCLEKIPEIETIPLILDLENVHDENSEMLETIFHLLREKNVTILGIKNIEENLGDVASYHNIPAISDATLSHFNEKIISETETKYIAPLIIDKPIRSGQQIYAENTDLIITSLVSEGAEVLADGNIHVYAPLKGRAIAGASGNKNARIFAQVMQAELVSIAGVYRIFDQKLPNTLYKKPVSIELHENKLLISALSL